jgi:hypothetical protein
MTSNGAPVGDIKDMSNRRRGPLRSTTEGLKKAHSALLILFRHETAVAQMAAGKHGGVARATRLGMAVNTNCHCC